MIPAEWVKRNERELTPEQVKRLEPGSKVTRISADRYGECVRTDYTVTCSGKKKVLTTRDPATWELIVRQIKPNENCKYVILREERQT